jgi:hypothetical protein
MKRCIILPSSVTAFVALSPVGVALANNPHLQDDGTTTTGSTEQGGWGTRRRAVAARLQHRRVRQCGGPLRRKRRHALSEQCQEPARRESIRRRRLPVHPQGTLAGEGATP